MIIHFSAIKMANSKIPRSIPIAEPVLGNSAISSLHRMDTTYFPLGYFQMVAQRMRPGTPRLLANFTCPSLGGFSRLSCIEML